MGCLPVVTSWRSTPTVGWLVELRGERMGEYMPMQTRGKLGELMDFKNVSLKKQINLKMDICLLPLF